MFKLKKVKSRTVTLYGTEFNVPAEVTAVNYAATDKCGDVWLYEEIPRVLIGAGIWAFGIGEGFELATIRYKGDWKDSLVKL